MDQEMGPSRVLSGVGTAYVEDCFMCFKNDDMAPHKD